MMQYRAYAKIHCLTLLQNMYKIESCDKISRASKNRQIYREIKKLGNNSNEKWKDAEMRI